MTKDAKADARAFAARFSQHGATIETFILDGVREKPETIVAVKNLVNAYFQKNPDVIDEYSHSHIQCVLDDMEALCALNDWVRTSKYAYTETLLDFLDLDNEDKTLGALLFCHEEESWFENLVDALKNVT